ncbi:MAG TPA: hypothetical protein VGR72_07280 [Candidatus Acidoferrales bacterium]|nr:hypothetical protein [Candidatus Acidoferrales bacterium]
MLATLQGYFGQFESLLNGVKSYVEQNQSDLAVLAGVVLLVVCASWINGVWKRAQFRRELRNSELIAYQLERIAGALERLARFQHSGVELSRGAAPAQERAESEAELPRPAGVGSMFGFSRGMTLPNPMYRPK